VSCSTLLLGGGHYLWNGTEYLENRTATYVLTAASDLHKHEDGNLRMDNLGRNTNVNGKSAESLYDNWVLGS